MEQDQQRPMLKEETNRTAEQTDRNVGSSLVSFPCPKISYCKTRGWKISCQEEKNTSCWIQRMIQGHISSKIWSCSFR